MTFTVKELNQIVRETLAKNTQLMNCQVEGEISDFKAHSNGNYYLKLKEENEILNVFISKRDQQILNNLDLGVGSKIVAQGYISTNGYSSSYLLNAKRVVLSVGIGEMYIQLENLKQKLKNEGLFDNFRKKKIPRYPRKIGIITSPNGAVIHDFVRNINKRFPAVEIIMFPSLVQGSDAPESLMKALQVADSFELDVIVIARGGGSFEDLFCFNDEGLARAIAAAKTPIISAVGHESDVTICDFVADLRSATPTEAATAAVPDIDNEFQMLDALTNQFQSFIQKYLLIEKQSLQLYQKSFSQDFTSILQKQINFLFEQKNQISTFLLESLYQEKENLQSYANQLKESWLGGIHLQKEELEFFKNDLISLILGTLHDEKMQISQFKNQIEKSIISQIHEQKLLLSRLETEIKSSDHASILEKGYSLTMKGGKIVKKIEELQSGDLIETWLQNGKVSSVVK